MTSENVVTGRTEAIFGLTMKTPGQNLIEKVGKKDHPIGIPTFRLGEAEKIIAQALRPGKGNEDNKDKLIVCMGFGINTPRLTQVQIAETLKLNPKKVSERAKKAIERLQDPSCKNKLKKLVMSPEELSSYIEFLHRNIKGLQDSVSSLQSNNESLKNDIVALQDSVSSLQSNNESLKNDIVALQDEASNLQSLQRENKGLKFRMKAVSEDLDNKSKELEELRVAKANYVEDLNGLSEKLNSLKEENEKLLLDANRAKSELAVAQKRESLAREAFNAIRVLINEQAKAANKQAEDLTASLVAVKLSIQDLQLPKDVLDALGRIGVNDIDQLCAQTFRGLSKMIGVKYAKTIKDGLEKNGLLLKVV